MKIKTKYNIGDEVYFKDNTYICKCKILNIQIECNFGHHISIIYQVSDKRSPFKIIPILEWQLFPTKEELVKSL